ncbi:hypothetical protein PC116_g2604 [Phytophthora cactorum]|nr:hypothetical protein PC116_g2604 [Phytophthora cactorum]
MSFLLDDTDQSVMEAALSLVDEFAGDVVGAQDPITVSAPQASQEDCVQALVSKAQMAPREHINERKKMLRAAGVYGNSNHVRNNRRIEIAYLKEQLEKLQIDLEELKKQQGRDKTRARSRAAPSRAPAAQLPTAEALAAMNGPTMTTVWENIADSQRRRRKKAECENIRLKMVIEHQQKVADNLRSLIQKRASQLGAECSFFADVDYTNHHVLDLRGDVGEFQSLFRNLDNAYQEMDAVFALNGLNSMVVTRSDVQVRDGPGGKCVELFFNKVLPFKLQDAREAAWEHFRGSEKHMGNGSVYEKTAEVGVTVNDRAWCVVCCQTNALLMMWCVGCQRALHDSRRLHEGNALEQCSGRCKNEASRPASCRAQPRRCHRCRKRQSSRSKEQEGQWIKIPSSKLRGDQVVCCIDTRARSVTTAVLLAHFVRRGDGGEARV